MSKKQALVSRSSTEAEYCSLVATIAELTWLKSLLSELQVPLTQAPIIYCDNLSTVLMIANPVLHYRSKHFELDLHFVRENVARKLITISHFPSHKQTTDILTKSISSFEFPLCTNQTQSWSFTHSDFAGVVREKSHNES